MKGKEMLQRVGVNAAKFRERVVLFFEPEFVHSPDCMGNVLLKRTVENKPSFQVIYRQCEVCGAHDDFKREYSSYYVPSGW